MPSRSSKSLVRRLALFFAFTLATVSALAVMLPVALQSPVADAQTNTFGNDFRDEEPTVRWLQGSSQKDAVEFLDTDEFRGGEGQEFARDLLTALGIDTLGVTFHRPDDVFDEDVELRAELPEHVLTKANDWRANFDVEAVASAMQSRGFSAFDIDICTIIDVGIEYVEPAEIEYDDCASWRFRTADAVRNGGVIAIAEDPTSGPYNRIVLWVVLVSVVLAAVFTALTVVLRRKSLQELGGANLSISLIGVFLAASAVTFTAVTFVAGVGSVDEVLLVENGGWREHVVLVMVPSLATALPFLLPAIVIVLAKPRSVQSESSGTTGGVPYWMTAPPQGVPQPQPAPWQPGPPSAPPQPPTDPSSPDRWDPPS
jgi:hypothetical protein